ncbi:mCG140916, isoform CRA_b [Mus musculus]|nr:mCG140916, isoform CRA_b [Mus musculus]
MGLSPGATPESPPSLTCLAARSLRHAGQICSFPSLEQSVAPPHCRKSTSEPGSPQTSPFLLLLQRELPTWLNTLPACLRESRGQI